MKIKSRKEVEQYLNSDKIECLECGKRFKFLPVHINRTHGLSAPEYRQRYNLPAGTPLAGLEYRRAQSDKLKRMIDAGTLTHDHLPNAVEAARKSERPRRTDYDLAEQSERAASIERDQLELGSRRKDGRDADRAREYQREYRTREKREKNKK